MPWFSWCFCSHLLVQSSRRKGWGWTSMIGSYFSAKLGICWPNHWKYRWVDVLFTSIDNSIREMRVEGMHQLYSAVMAMPILQNGLAMDSHNSCIWNHLSISFYDVSFRVSSFGPNFSLVVPTGWTSTPPGCKQQNLPGTHCQQRILVVSSSEPKTAEAIRLLSGSKWHINKGPNELCWTRGFF